MISFYVSQEAAGGLRVVTRQLCTLVKLVGESVIPNGQFLAAELSTNIPLQDTPDTHIARREMPYLRSSVATAQVVMCVLLGGMCYVKTTLHSLHAEVFGSLIPCLDHCNTSLVEASVAISVHNAHEYGRPWSRCCTWVNSSGSVNIRSFFPRNKFNLFHWDLYVLHFEGHAGALHPGAAAAAAEDWWSGSSATPKWRQPLLSTLVCTPTLWIHLVWDLYTKQVSKKALKPWTKCRRIVTQWR